MWVKICKKAVLILTAVLLLASVAMVTPAASALVENSALVGGSAPSRDSSLVREIEGGITVEFKGITVSNNRLIVTYTVTSETDQVINVDTNEANLFTNNGTLIRSRGIVFIGDNQTRSILIADGIPTTVTVYYDARSVEETYARLTFIINGERLVFRNVHSQPE